MALEISSVSLFEGDTPKTNVYSRLEYTHFKRVDNKVVDEETQEETVDTRYYIVINVSYYTSKEHADNKTDGQPFEVDRVEKEITYEQYCLFCDLSYAIVKAEDKYKDCKEV